jgi:methionyl-tRNA formyltransferase
MVLQITLLLDKPETWFAPYADALQMRLQERGHSVLRVERAQDLPLGDCAFFLSCEKIVPEPFLSRNRHNIVVHASDLPKGKGWSPLTWQILEGKNDIPLTLFEAAKGVDSGPIYAQDVIRFEGHELIDEMREREGNAIVALALRFIDAYENISGRAQAGEETFYRRRTPKDSELEPTKSLTELFSQLRVADNERYPAFFSHKGHTYVLKIYKKRS